MTRQGPPIDPELAGVLAELVVQPVTADGIAAMRAEQRVATDAELSRSGAIDVSTVDIDGMPAVQLRPAGATGPLPGILYLHGGGMISGHARSGLQRLLDWVVELGVVVVSPEYRLAPEHPHPAPSQDCYAALNWMARNGSPLVVAGASAGGGLAAAVTLMARDLGGPELRGQMLLFPMLDDRCTTASTHEPDHTWGRTSNLTGWTALLGAARGGPDVSPYAAPARAADLSGLPRTFLDVGSADLYRDETVEYAARMWRDGGDAELHVWPGGFHAFDLRAPSSRLSRQARDARLEWLRSTLES